MARLPVVTGLFLVALAHVAMSITVQEFFPDIKNNLTKITWSHATNSKQELERALNSSDVMMIEADVTMGFVTGTPDKMVPIMAHPPTNESDLSLSEFMKHAIVPTNATKGVKLDFKSIEAFKNSTDILSSLQHVKAPIWLNADILRGPNSTDDQKTVNSVTFLQKAQTLAEQASVLSIGWTTGYQPHSQNVTTGNYTRQQIDEMVKLVKETVKTNQSITYPVRACYAANDIELMTTLLANTPAVNNPTLTIWSSADDKVDAEKLSLLVRTIGVAKVFVDVPKDLMMKLNFNSAFTAQSSAFVVFASMMFALFTAKLL